MCNHHEYAQGSYEYYLWKTYEPMNLSVGNIDFVSWVHDYYVKNPINLWIWICEPTVKFMKIIRPYQYEFKLYHEPFEYEYEKMSWTNS